MGCLITRLSRALKQSEGAEHIYLFVFGHHVDYLHVWLILRYPDTPREYWGTKVDEWPGAPRGGSHAVAELVSAAVLVSAAELSNRLREKLALET